MAAPALRRFWVSWYSGNYADEGCTRPPYTFWSSGSADRYVNGQLDTVRDELTLCAVIDAETADAVWPQIRRYFPDYRERFCEEKAGDFMPGERFL